MVSDEDVEMIAMNHQSDWESLSPLLELSDAQALTVSQLPCEHQSRMCLVLWKAAKGNDATYGALITAAERAGDQQLVDEVKGLVIGMYMNTRMGGHVCIWKDDPSLVNQTAFQCCICAQKKWSGSQD